MTPTLAPERRATEHVRLVCVRKSTTKPKEVFCRLYPHAKEGQSTVTAGFPRAVFKHENKNVGFKNFCDSLQRSFGKEGQWGGHLDERFQSAKQGASAHTKHALRYSVRAGAFRACLPRPIHRMSCVTFLSLSPPPFNSVSPPPSLHPSSSRSCRSSLHDREIERPLSPRGDDGRDGGGSEHDAEDFGDDRNQRKIFATNSGRADTVTGAAGRHPPPSSHRRGVGSTSDSSAYGSEEDDGFDYGDSESTVDDDDDGDDEAGGFGSAYGSGGERGSYRGDDSDGEYGGAGRRGDSAGERAEGSGEGGSVESFRLSGNSSEWTPLRGADLVSPSSRQDRAGDWFSRSAPHGKVRKGVQRYYIEQGVYATAATVARAVVFLRVRPCRALSPRRKRHGSKIRSRIASLLSASRGARTTEVLVLARSEETSTRTTNEPSSS